MPVLLQNLVTALVSAAVADFGGLDYSTTAAGAVLDTLALISGSGDALGSESKVSHHLVDPWGGGVLLGDSRHPFEKCDLHMPWRPTNLDRLL